MFNLSESTPATLCRYTTCSGCTALYELQVRNGYNGVAYFGSCSRDWEFCIDSDASKTVLILRFHNTNRYINMNEWHKEDADGWCRSKNGMAYWFEA